MKIKIPLDEIELILKVGMDAKIRNGSALVRVDSVKIEVGRNQFKEISPLINFEMKSQLLEKVFETDDFKVQTDEWDFENCQHLDVEFEPAPTMNDAHDIKSIMLVGHDLRPYLSVRADNCIEQSIDKHIDGLKNF